jgi:hypothetical protein
VPGPHGRARRHRAGGEQPPAAMSRSSKPALSEPGWAQAQRPSASPAGRQGRPRLNSPVSTAVNGPVILSRGGYARYSDLSGQCPGGRWPTGWYHGASPFVPDWMEGFFVPGRWRPEGR